jgi:hypothetical protein
MATRQRKTPDSGVVGRLAGRGEEAMSRLMDELGRNSAVTEALTRAVAAKGMLDSASRTALTQVGLAPADEVRELRRRVIDLEKRLGKLEGASTRKRKPTTKTTASKGKTTSTAKTARGATGRRSGPKT